MLPKMTILLEPSRLGQAVPYSAVPVFILISLFRGSIVFIYTILKLRVVHSCMVSRHSIEPSMCFSTTCVLHTIVSEVSTSHSIVHNNKHLSVSQLYEHASSPPLPGMCKQPAVTVTYSYLPSYKIRFTFCIFCKDWYKPLTMNML